MIPFGEFAPDVADYNLEVATVADNCIPGVNGYRPLKALGATQHTITLALGFVAHYPPVGIYWNHPEYDPFFIVSEGGAMFVSGASFQQSPLTINTTFANGGYPFVIWDDDLIITGGPVPPQIISASGLDDGGTTKTTDLGGSPPASYCGAKVREFLVLGQVNDGTYRPYRLVWSGFDDNTEWTAGDNQSGIKDLNEGGDIKRIIGGDDGLIFQKNDVFRMTYIGVPAIFSFDRVEGAIGTGAGLSVVEVGSDIYYLANDGFRVMRGRQVSEPIGQGRIDKWFWGVLGGLADAEDVLNYVQGAYDSASGCVMWSFPDVGFTEGSPCARLIIYNIKLNKWSTATIDLYTLFATDLQVGAGADDYIQPHALFGYNGSAGAVTGKFFDGSDLTATIETGHIFNEGSKTEVTGVRPVCSIPGRVSVLSKPDEIDDAEATAGPTTPKTNGVADFRAEGKYHRIRWDSNATAFDNALGVVVNQSQTGDR